ncbi:carboxypeptidase-like regulatory domain-containing protein [Lacinutrix chionoecetis]
MKFILQIVFMLCLVNQAFAQNQATQDKEIVSGIVLDEDGNPFPNVSVIIDGTTEGVQTNLYGNYTINVAVGKNLIYSFNGYEQEKVMVTNANPINLSLKPAVIKQGDVVVTSLGLKRSKDKIGFGYQEVNNKQLNQANNPNALSSLVGKVSSLQINKDRNAVVLRGFRSLRGDNTALIVIDGAISSFTFLDALDPNTIESINVIKGAAGSALYGSQGSNGVIVVTSKKANYNPTTTNNTYQPKPIKYRKKLKIKNKNVKPPYIKALEKEVSIDDAFLLYNDQKDDYKNHSSYYVDVYSFFADKGDKNYSKKVLNDIVISKIDDYQTLKALAMKLLVDQEYDLASTVYKRLLILRPRDAQSFIDLAQVYNERGEKQRAFNLLNDLLELTKNASKINGVVTNEINGLLQTSKGIDDSNLETYNKLNTSFDLRILASWNREDSNVNLEVVNPSLEVASKENIKTRFGGELVNVADAFGPEEYTIRNARKGDYFVNLKYDAEQHLEDQNLFVKLIIYKNFGKENQEKEIKIIKLDASQGETLVHKISL